MNTPVAQLRCLDMRNTQLAQNPATGGATASAEIAAKPSPAKELRAQLRAQLVRNQPVAQPPVPTPKVASELRPSEQAKLAELRDLVAWLRAAEPELWTAADEAEAIEVGSEDIGGALVCLRALKAEKHDVAWATSVFYRQEVGHE